MIRSHKRIIYYPEGAQDMTLVDVGDVLVAPIDLSWEAATQVDEIIGSVSPIITPRGNLVGNLTLTVLKPYADRLEAEEWADKHPINLMLNRQGELTIINRSGTYAHTDRYAACIANARALPMQLERYLGDDYAWIAAEYSVQLTILPTTITT